jgi:hypothetical protein
VCANSASTGLCGGCRAIGIPTATARVGAVDEATIKAYIESQKWDEDDQGFKITAPAEP